MGIDPFGLWWSGEPIGRSDASAPPPSPIRCRLRADSGGHLATAELERYWLAPGATVTEVREHGVCGVFARPPGLGPFPGVVALGGSGGGLGPAAVWAPVLASHGFATLAIAYFGVPGLADDLVGIEIEVIERAAQWLLDRRDIAPVAVAVIGQSRGSELALLAGTLLDSVGPVVGFAPSGISWCGLDTRGPVDAPAWTFRGEAIPYARIGEAAKVASPSRGPIALCAAFEATLENKDAFRSAVIPVERIHGPILFVSGEADAMWPATRMTEIAEARAREHHFPRAVGHLRYPDGGHMCGGIPGIPVAAEVRHPLTSALYTFGGSQAANARARADSWPRVLAFLRAAFGRETDAPCHPAGR